MFPFWDEFIIRMINNSREQNSIDQPQKNCEFFSWHSFNLQRPGWGQQMIIAVVDEGILVPKAVLIVVDLIIEICSNDIDNKCTHILTKFNSKFKFQKYLFLVLSNSETQIF